MAKRPEKMRAKEKAISARVRKHIGALNLESYEDYIGWCFDNGFAPTAEKSYDDLHDEKRAFQRLKDAATARTKIHRSPQRFIEQACAGEITPKDVTRPTWHQVCRSIDASKPDKDSRAALCALLLAVEEKADFLFDSVSYGSESYRYIDALIQLNNRRRQWIRSLAEWQVETHNHHRQFSTLLRHLIARYSIPFFMDSAWFRREQGAYRLRDWYVHVGSGKNIRTAKSPVPLTKKMAHHFLQAPDHYSIENALRWGQIHALGGDRRLTEAVLGSRIGEHFEQDAFWQSVIRFFIANPMLDRRHVGPIVDYLQDQKFESHEVVVGPGQVEVQGPPQPNLSMNGRTPERLLRQVEVWHQNLGRITQAKNQYFKKSGIEAFEKPAGEGGKKTWIIRELLSGAELVEEGKAMRHCVASYADSCVRGRCSIWAMAMELRTPGGVEKRQTIEISDRGVLAQCRGKRNRHPTAGEFEVIKQWAATEDLIISNYVPGYD